MPHDAARDDAGTHLVLVRMRALRPELRPSEQRIADLFLADPAGTAGLSVAELAHRCDTSTTSVVRFCKRLGYEHVRELRNHVLREVERETFDTAALPAVSGDRDLPAHGACGGRQGRHPRRVCLGRFRPGAG